jgi:predicted nucleic acid-binding protein
MVGLSKVKRDWIRTSPLTKIKTHMKATNKNMYLTSSSTEELRESEKISNTAWGTKEIEELSQYELVKSLRANVSSGEW